MRKPGREEGYLIMKRSRGVVMRREEEDPRKEVRSWVGGGL